MADNADIAADLMERRMQAALSSRLRSQQRLPEELGRPGIDDHPRQVI